MDKNTVDPPLAAIVLCKWCYTPGGPQKTEQSIFQDFALINFLFYE